MTDNTILSDTDCLDKMTAHSNAIGEFIYCIVLSLYFFDNEKNLDYSDIIFANEWSMDGVCHWLWKKWYCGCSICMTVSVGNQKECYNQ